MPRFTKPQTFVTLPNQKEISNAQNSPWSMPQHSIFVFWRILLQSSSHESKSKVYTDLVLEKILVLENSHYPWVVQWDNPNTPCSQMLVPNALFHLRSRTCVLSRARCLHSSSSLLGIERSYDDWILEMMLRKSKKMVHDNHHHISLLNGANIIRK